MRVRGEVSRDSRGGRASEVGAALMTSYGGLYPGGAGWNLDARNV